MQNLKIFVLTALLMIAPPLAMSVFAQSDVIIETPHARTLSSAERTMFYDITTKNAGTLSATVASSASSWLTASLSGTRLTLHVAANYTSSARYGDITITDETSGVSQVFTVTQKGNESSGAAPSGLKASDFSSLFEDNLWTKLKSSVNQTTINNISNSFVKNLAQAIYDGGYSTTYRVHTAHCFKSPDVISSEWNASGKYYDRTGNVTGIHVPNNSRIAIWIPSIPSGATLTLMIRSWYPGQKTTSGTGTLTNYDPITKTHTLKQGLNLIEYSVSGTSGATESPSDGLAYVAYFADKDDQYADVPMHFLNGIENGYLSLDLTNDQMHDLCKNAPNMHMDVVSEHAHMVWEANALYKYCRSTTQKGESSGQGSEKGYRQYIRLMEYLISSEHKALGLQKYNRVPKTRTLAYVNYYYFMYQGNYGVAFCYDVQESCLDLYKMLKAEGASVWGISHEWGHQHQMRPYFNWSGCDESTNNINSYWNTVACGLTDESHGCHPGMGTILYNGTASGKLSANCNIEYSKITNARQHAYDTKSSTSATPNVSWNSNYTTLVNNTYNNHLDWTSEDKDGVYSFDYSNYDSARPFIALMFYMMENGKPDFSYDLYEAIRQTDAASGSTIVGSTIEKSGVDKYELLAAAQNGNSTAYTQFNDAYKSSSVWRTKNYLSSTSSYRVWTQNAVPFIFNFIRKASRLSGYNLFPYFEKCGLLRQVAWRTYTQYNQAWYLMTEDMYNEFKNDMNALGLKTCDDEMVKTILTVENPNWSLPSSINND